MGPSDVVERAREVLDFWLRDTPKEKRFAADPALDAEIERRFGALRDSVVRTHAADWADDPTMLLAAIVLTDQFSRNLFRGSAAAFASDGLARELARYALDRGWDKPMPPLERQFLCMPFMHAESRTDQLLSVALFEAIGDDDALRYARLHLEQIERFGRFPQRNEALGRTSTPDEIAFLSSPGARF